MNTTPETNACIMLHAGMPVNQVNDLMKLARKLERERDMLIVNGVYVISTVGRVRYGPIINLIGVSPSPHLGFNPERFMLLSEMREESKLISRQPNKIENRKKQNLCQVFMTLNNRNS